MGHLTQKFFDETRLSDTGLPGNEYETPVAVRVQPQLRQARKFIVPADERPVKVTMNAHGREVRLLRRAPFGILERNGGPG
jgi:hypothetical protein